MGVRWVPAVADASTVTQLSLIGEIAEACRGAGIRFWLRGGWALDFLTGEVTRSHSDVDVVTWARHAARIQGLLGSHGYQIVEVHAPTAIDFSKNGQAVGIVFIKRDVEGRIVTPGTEWDWPRPAGGFGDRVQRLQGVACRVMTPEALLEEKEQYERRRGHPLRPKDRDSITRLRAMLSVR